MEDVLAAPQLFVVAAVYSDIPGGERILLRVQCEILASPSCSRPADYFSFLSGMNHKSLSIFFCVVQIE
jgi:hypothetical protein